MVSVRVTRPARSRLSDVYLRKPFNRSRFYAFLSNGSESGNFQTKAIVRPSSHSECSESLVFAFINTQRESFKASWPVVKGSLTETQRAAPSADFAEVFLWKVAQSERWSVKSWGRWRGDTDDSRFYSHADFWHIYLPDLLTHVFLWPQILFPLWLLPWREISPQKSSDIFFFVLEEFWHFVFSRVHAVWWCDAGHAAGNSPSAVVKIVSSDCASCLI